MRVDPSIMVSGMRALRVAWLALSCLVFTPAVWALDLGAKASFDIPPQKLTSALVEFSRQSGVPVASSTRDVEQFDSPGVVGEMSVQDGLNAILAGTSLGWKATASGGLAVGRFAAGRVSDAGDGGAQELSKVMVVGSRLARTAKENAQETRVYSDRDIEQSGQGTLSDFLNTLPEVSTATPEHGTVYAGQTTVTLRGLPQGTTLILINGRRVENGGGTAFYGGYFDLNNIPAAAVARIEILPEGSSAIYGSDALAGVVNVVLKKDFDGVQLDTHYGFASGVDEASTDFAWGKVWDHLSLSVVGSYYTRGELDGSERAITAGIADPSLAADRCSPGNVYSVDGGNLPGLGAPSAGVLGGIRGTPTLADFSAGQINQCRTSTADGDVIPSTQRINVFGFVNYQLTPSISLFAELMYTHYGQDNKNGYSTFEQQMLGASNPYNPFGQNVLVSYMFHDPQGMVADDNHVNFLRPLVGARGKLFRDWTWEIAAWQTGDRSESSSADYGVNTANLAAALNSSDPATAFNPFTSGPAASSAVLNTLFTNNEVKFQGQSQIVNGFVSGHLFTLASGPVQLVAGGEYVRSKVVWGDVAGAVDDPYSNFSYRRDVDSFFSELKVPLIGNHEHPESGDILAVSGAFRFDNYDDFGSHATPQYAIEWRPLESLLVRGAYAKAFRAPELIQLYEGHESFDGYCCVTDPLRNNASTAYTVIYGGNPNLKAETGQSRSVGLVWSPKSAKGLEASLTYWGVDQSNRAAQGIDPQAIVDNPDLFPGRVQRGPSTDGLPGPILSVDDSFANYGALVVSGFDFDLNYRYRSDFGVLTPSVSLVETYKYQAAIAPGAPMTDRVSRATVDAWAPRWKGTVGLGWESGPYSAHVDARYTGRYLDSQESGPTTRELGNFWLYDLSAKCLLGKVLAPQNAYLRGTFAQLGVVNLFNSLPVYSSAIYNEIGYDPEQYDIRGRFIYANLGVKW